VYLIGVAIFVGALDSVEKGDKIGKLLKFGGIVSLVWGILLLVGAAYGGHDITKPLAKTSITYVQNQNTTATKTNKQTFFNISDIQILNAKLTEAKEAKKMVILYFYTDVCPVCKHLKETTWKDPAVKNLLSDKYVALSINMTDPKDKNINAIKTRFSIFGPPGFVFFNGEGEELKKDSFYGYQSPEDMFDILDLLAE
jgi:thiol:disulfide interchange protein DsbD